MKFIAAACIGIALQTTALAGESTDSVPNYSLRPGPWVEGYIPTPPAEASYRENANEIEALAGVSSTAAFFVWVWNVRIGGIWDYKKDLRSPQEFTRLEASGNFNFGVTAAALGLTYPEAQFLAGMAQVYAIEKNNYRFSKFRVEDFGIGPTGGRLKLAWDRISPFYYGPSAFYDDPSDAVSIKAGYDWYLRTHITPPAGMEAQGSADQSNASPSTQYEYLKTLNTPFWDMLLDRQIERWNDERSDIDQYDAYDPFDLPDTNVNNMEALPQHDDNKLEDNREPRNSDDTKETDIAPLR
ncbi:polymorphic toxin type 44 domain-containing protein [Microvirga sesbaniae]|uniref:polymorphic toxin type 44 domain-containing protein n=1 Tax=Microvirga sesbaniae TaxID=681392 RepID=UPI0021C8EC12|nr:polymorphic toxin type 44 domain-containing protein [Microvirga sp. HBU67692]